MAKAKTRFVCQTCGYVSPRYLGRCPNCGEWNTLVEEIEESKNVQTAPRVTFSGTKVKPQLIDAISTKETPRIVTKNAELNRVLGGGIVPSSMVLIGGDPGIGKSTMLLQLSGELADMGGKVLYVSGEESANQIKMRADRLGVGGSEFYLYPETDMQSILQNVEDLKPDYVVIDSVQTMQDPELTSAVGSVAQIRSVTASLMQVAKVNGITVFIVGHVTKGGAIAGPKILEHMVDTVLYFEGDRHASYRILRAVKNRFGSTNEIGVFEMCNTGLEEVKNPSEYMLNGRPEDASGSVVACSMEGTRPILVEIQALVCQSNFGIPRRTAVGTDFNRVNLLMAVLEKKVGLRLAASDAYVNIAGGMKMTEPAIDLGICLAIVSSAKDIVIPDNVMVFGEVGLSGEIRAVNMAGQRVQEAKKLGFGTVVLPEVCRSSVGKVEGINLVYVSQIRDAIGYIMKK